MKKVKEQLIALLLAGSMAFGLLPVSAFADMGVVEETSSMIGKTIESEPAAREASVRDEVELWANVPMLLSEEETSEEIVYIAEVDGVQYSNLQQAFDAADENTTVTMLQDVKLSESVIVSNQTTLDLNGCSISRGEGNTKSWMIGILGNLTIKDSSPNNTGIIVSENYVGTDGKTYGGYSVLNNGILTIESGNFESYFGVGTSLEESVSYIYGGTFKSDYMAIAVMSGSELVVEDGNIEGNVVGIFVTGEKEEAPTKVTIRGGNISSEGFAVSGNGLQDYTDIVIEGGTLTSTAANAIYHPQIGDLTITGGEITGVSGVQYCGAGTVKISGDAVIRATGEYTEFPTKPVEQGDGSADDGAAISFVSRGGGYQSEGDEINVEITGGNFISENNAAIAVYRLAKINNKWVTNEQASNINSYLKELEISGGTFKSGEQKGALEIDDVANEAISITGGTFSGTTVFSFEKDGENQLYYAPETYYRWVNADETYTIAKKIPLVWDTTKMSASKNVNEAGEVQATGVLGVNRSDAQAIRSEDTELIQKIMDQLNDTVNWKTNGFADSYPSAVLVENIKIVPASEKDEAVYTSWYQEIEENGYIFPTEDPVIQASVGKLAVNLSAKMAESTKEYNGTAVSLDNVQVTATIEGTPVEDAEYAYTWYEVSNGQSFDGTNIEDLTKLDGAPANAGKYVLAVVVAQSDKAYTSNAAYVEFTINKKQLTWNVDGMSASKSDTEEGEAEVKGFFTFNGVADADAEEMKEAMEEYNAILIFKTEGIAGKPIGSYPGTPIVYTEKEPGSLEAFGQKWGYLFDNYTTPEDVPTITAIVTEDEKVTYIPLPDEEEESGIDQMLRVEEGLSSVPDGLTDEAGYESVDEINEALTEIVKQTVTETVGENVAEEAVQNTIVYDVQLLYSEDNGTTWKKADEENFPKDGLLIKLPYPDGTDSSYSFTVVHMFTTSAFGKTPGDTETPTVTKLQDGIQFTVTGLSPIAVSYVKEEVQPEQPIPSSQSDDSVLIGAAVVGTIAAVVIAANWKYLPIHKIEGSIQDKVWNGLPGATVTLMQDDKVLKTVTTNEGGGYRMYVPKGVYTLEVTYVVPETGETVSTRVQIEGPTKENSGDIVLNW